MKQMLAYGNNGKDVNFEVDGFCNYIDNFIFHDRLASTNGGDSIQQGFPVFQYHGQYCLLLQGLQHILIYILLLQNGLK